MEGRKGFSSDFSPAIHIFAGENVCIQAIITYADFAGVSFINYFLYLICILQHWFPGNLYRS
jgi:hypothetical protein